MEEEGARLWRQEKEEDHGEEDGVHRLEHLSCAGSNFFITNAFSSARITTGFTFDTIGKEE
ncbi:Zn-dependent exopeptidase M28 [Sesbania bispinosa]|nr:Zn-dependent exopeptidase M28 [Sesbania bispinosa]